ncbi:hypothetical protein NC652_019869 [Populus alba x Populus x berolinensis]|nr:hypothetical protein NC652_019869 [Populus alba x Populus x berolinensis]
MDEHKPWLGEFNWGPRADPFDMAAKEARKIRWHDFRTRLLRFQTLMWITRNKRSRERERERERLEHVMPSPLSREESRGGEPWETHSHAFPKSATCMSAEPHLNKGIH